MTVVFVVVDIGCLSCGERSAVLGIFRDKDKAQRVADEADIAQEFDREGQHSFEVFEAEWQDDTRLPQAIKDLTTSQVEQIFGRIEYAGGRP